MHLYGIKMGTKTITISLAAYEALVREKRPGESFSDVILRLVKKSGDLMELAGSWKDVSDEFVEEFLKEIKEAWATWKSMR